MKQHTDISVALTPQLHLKHALIQASVENPASVFRLTISGMLTQADFKYIRAAMRDTLQELDMGKAMVKRKRFPAFALRDCAGLTSVIIPDSVTEIGGYAFSGCTNITSMVIPDSVTGIDANVFFECYKLTNIKTTAIVKFEDNAFYECPALGR